MSYSEPGWLLSCDLELDHVAAAADVLSVSAAGDDLGDAVIALVRVCEALDTLREAGAVGVDEMFNAASAQDDRLHVIISGQVRSCITRSQLPSSMTPLRVRVGQCPLSV